MSDSHPDDWSFYRFMAELGFSGYDASFGGIGDSYFLVMKLCVTFVGIMYGLFR